jgi:lipopolysaccharide biosynthesis glycosyltransferase
MSILDHSNTGRKYDLVIFNRDISEENKQKLQEILRDKENMHLRFINPMSLLSDVTLNVTFPNFKEECYFRLVAPLILKNYTKIIFTDIDLLVLDDISKLGEIDMQGQVVAACLDVAWKESYITNRLVKGYGLKEYTDNVLRLPNPTDYYNTGVVVFDVKKFIQMNAFERLKQTINNNYLIYLEQCALNMCMSEHFHRLPDVWNYELSRFTLHNFDKYDFYREYVTQEKDAKIMHFLGENKPWMNPWVNKADLWWGYASRTPFFAEILLRFVDFKVETALKPTVAKSNVAVSTAKTGLNTANEAVRTLNHTTQLAYVSQHLLAFRWKKWRYQVKKTLLSGNKRSKYLNKYRSVRELIKEAERFRRKMSEV